MAEVIYPTAERGRPLAAVRMAEYATRCGWKAGLTPPHKASDLDVVRFSARRGKIGKPGFEELHMVWYVPRGKKSYTRRGKVYLRTGDGPWTEDDLRLNEVAQLISRAERS